jgi:hypothetical protein
MRSKLAFGTTIALFFPLVSPAYAVNRIDLGTIAPAALVKAEFQFKNVGTEDLLLSNAQPSCGCVSLQLDEVTSPQGLGKLSAVFRAPEITGVYAESLDVNTNDSSRKAISLRVQFKVQSAVSLDTDEVRFEKSQNGGSNVVRINVSSSLPGFSPQGLISSNPYVTTRIEKRTQEATYMLIVALQQGVPEGILYATITFATGISTEPEVKVPVFANIERNGVKRKSPASRIQAHEANTKHGAQ